MNIEVRHTTTYAVIAAALCAVVNDMALETSDRLYDFAGVRTFMYY